jgi:hypothetical protein
VTTLNRAAESMLGLRVAVVRGRPWREAFARADLATIGKLPVVKSTPVVLRVENLD